MRKMPSDKDDPLKDWNPMRDAYNDSKFNKYSSGPGADLEDSLQPAGLAKQKSHSQKSNDPYLVFKQIPSNLTLNGLINICSSHGKVLRGSKHDANMYFVNFASVNDMERVFTNLQDNPYGFKVVLGKNVKRDQLPQKFRMSENQENLHFAPPTTNDIDYDRSYQISLVNRPRPRFVKEPLVCEEDYDNPANILSLVDPQRHFLIDDDAFDLERLDYAANDTAVKGGYNYRMGRALYVMPQKDKQLIEEKRKTTSGFYDPNEEKFTKRSPIADEIKTGPCESCKKLCAVVCARCSAFFCSVECQTKEWPMHRWTCGKPPGFIQPSTDNGDEVDEEHSNALEKPSESLDATKQAALETEMPHTGCHVQLTAISKTNVVFVRSKTFNANLKFFETVSSIQKEAKTQDPVVLTPERGDIVITKFNDEQFNRAMILNPDNPDHIKLVYVDYGNIDTKSISELFKAPEELWRLPRMALPIILKDVPDVFMTEEIKNYMYTYLNKDLKIVYQAEDVQNSVHRAELFDLVTNESFNKNIAALMAVPAEINQARVLFYKDLTLSPLPTGENVKLLVMDSSLLQTAFVSCTTQPYAYALEKIQKDIQKYIADSPPDVIYTPRVDELCLAKYVEDNLWYRGRCLELVGDGHPTISFIDYGNITIVGVENIRRYPDEFQFPIMTRDCEIHGLPKVIPKELQDKLQAELEPGTEITCQRVEKDVDENAYIIYLPDLIKKVIN